MKKRLEKPMSGELNELIAKCRENDRRAQLALYNKFARTMYNTSYRLIKNETDAEDSMQEAFLSAFSKLDTYRGEVPFDAWLRRIVINKSLDCLRKKKIDFSELDDTTLSRAAETEIIISAEEDSILQQRKSMLAEEIQELAEGYRVIVSLYYFEGYDHEEIAKILGITQATSRSQLTRARKKLTDKMKAKKS